MTSERSRRSKARLRNGRFWSKDNDVKMVTASEDPDHRHPSRPTRMKCGRQRERARSRSGRGATVTAGENAAGWTDGRGRRSERTMGKSHQRRKETSFPWLPFPSPFLTIGGREGGRTRALLSAPFFPPSTLRSARSRTRVHAARQKPSCCAPSEFKWRTSENSRQLIFPYW